ncbi:hypothetical protein ACLOJK_018390 [Asimina triloba]
MAQGRRGLLSSWDMGMLLVAVLVVIATTLPKSAAHANGVEEAQQEKESSSPLSSNATSSNATAIASGSKASALFECIAVIPQMTFTCTGDLLYIVTHPGKRKRGLGRNCCRLFGTANDSCLRQFIKTFFRNYEWPELALLIYYLKNGCRLFT